MASIVKRNGNACTYTGNGGLLTGFPKGLRIFFKPFVHKLNESSTSYQKAIEKAGRDKAESSKE